MHYDRHEDGLRPISSAEIDAEYAGHFGGWKGKLRWWGFLVGSRLRKIKEGFMYMLS